MNLIHPPPTAADEVIKNAPAAPTRSTGAARVEVCFVSTNV